MSTTTAAPAATHTISTSLTDAEQSNPSALPKAPSLTQMAGAAKADRNRAIDFYRVIAMLAVAVGHWVAMDIAVDASGELTAGNALEAAPAMTMLTWLFQVMPLFFVVGGFSSAMSLDSFFCSKPAGTERGETQDWVIARLRRMLAPAVALATTWAVLIGGGFALGQGELIAIAATAAAIPLWFLANYTIDTAIAPYVLPLFRKHRVAVPTVGVAVFCALEAARFAGVPALPQVNWVLGWLLFQIAGFAWRDGLLPTGKTMLATATGFWVAAVIAVTLGPWPVSMVHFPGVENSPTHPPSLALMLFGAAYSCSAIALAPAISRWLGTCPKAWAAVVAGNSVAMSVYLWHFTAAITASAAFYVFGWLPTAAVGTVDWWLQKAPLLGVSALVLAAIVAKVMHIERNALLATRTRWVGGSVSVLVLAGVLSTALKQWAHGDFTTAAICIAVVIMLWHGVLKSDALIVHAGPTGAVKRK